MPHADRFTSVFPLIILSLSQIVKILDLLTHEWRARSAKPHKRGYRARCDFEVISGATWAIFDTFWWKPIADHFQN